METIMKKLMIAAVAACAVSVSGAAFALDDVNVEIDESFNRITDITSVDVTDVHTDITNVDYEDESLNVNGNDLFSNNVDYTSLRSTEVEVEDSFNEYDVSLTSVRNSVDVNLRDNDGFNDIRMRTEDNIAVTIGDTTAVYSYRPDNASRSDLQNDFGDLHSVSVTAVGSMSGPSISVGRSISSER